MRWGWVIFVACCATCGRAEEAAHPAPPRGLASLPVPDDNLPSPEKTALGWQLFFDPRLSVDNTISCASCHDPAQGWSNGTRFATGVGGQVGGRNVPTIVNAAYQEWQFWDGRARHLEGQALGPIQNPIEMNLSLPELVKKLNGIEGYRRQFAAAFGAPASADSVAQALASFERTVLSGNAPFDRFAAGDTSALSDQARRGHNVFFHKAHCSACHAGPNLSDGAFHNLGIGSDAAQPDLGRETVSGLLGDRCAFRTPTLREVARTAPYMHNGQFATLEQVIEFYDRGGVANAQLDEEIYPLGLSTDEKADLISFLEEALSSSDYPLVEKPELPR